MGAVTYPTDEVIREITDAFVPLKLECDFQKPTELMKRYHVRWTPTLFVLETDGRARFHTVGYMPPEDLVSRLELLRAMEIFDKGQLEEAIRRLREIVERYSASAAAPQALYYEGVAKYLRDHDARHLKNVYRELTRRFPEDLWARKSHAYAGAPG